MFKAQTTNKQGTLNSFLDVSLGTGTHAPRKRQAYASKRLQQVVSDFRRKRAGLAEEDNEGEEGEPVRKRRRTVVSKGKGKGSRRKGKGKQGSVEGEGEGEAGEGVGDSVEGNEDEGAQDAEPAKASRKRTTAKKPAAKKAPARKARKKRTASEEEEDDDDDADDDYQEEDDWELDCEVCGKHGKNVVCHPSQHIPPLTTVQNDGLAVACCEKCNKWQHIPCHDAADLRAGRKKRNWDEVEFMCRSCAKPKVAKTPSHSQVNGHGHSRPVPPPKGYVNHTFQVQMPPPTHAQHPPPPPAPYGYSHKQNIGRLHPGSFQVTPEQQQMMMM